MSQDDLQQQVRQLRDKLQKQKNDFQAYKTSAKELEEFLQQESQKKETEIRKLKEELILKDKGIKQAKQQLSLLQSDHVALKEQLASKSTGDSSQTSKLTDQLRQLQELVDSLQAKNSELTVKVSQKQNLLIQLTKDKSADKNQWQEKIQHLNEELMNRASKIEALQQERGKLSKRVSAGKSKEDLLSRNEPDLERRGSKNQVEVLKARLQKQRANFEQERNGFEDVVRKLDEALGKAEKQAKQARAKLQRVVEQNQMLKSRTVNVTINSCISSPSPMLIKSSLEDEDLSLRPSYHCLLMTKPHYISPFLQIYEDKSLIKIYKSSRTGCFEKSMGCYKHRFDRIAFDHQSLLEPIETRIRQYQESNHHSVFMFGAKKSNKKYLMSKLVANLREFLIQKIDDGEQVQVIFLKRSPDEEKNLTLKGYDRDGAIQVIDKVISIGCKSEKHKQKVVVSPRKVVSKPKVRYFKMRVGDFFLEIGTSSFTSLSFRDKVTVSTMLNNILYSKLPNILQSSISQKYLILTLNPIVDLYEDCKNTLSTTFCRSIIEQSRNSFQLSQSINRSPIRQELNEVAKKKLDNFQRQNEQSSVRMRKMQEEVMYYKSRFDDLEFRLKNLLNTHPQQNSYLKKSPVTLSYEKLLKFVHSVQARSTAGGGNSHSQSMMVKNSNIYAEKDTESIDDAL